MNAKELEKSAQRLISDKINNGEVVHMDWAVHEIISNQGEISGPGFSFYRLCAKEVVYRLVKKAVDKYDKATGDQKQLTLHGYECLQEAYTMDRDSERVLIPIHLIDDDELLARAKEFRKQSKGLLKHAKELEAFVSERRKTKVKVAV